MKKALVLALVVSFVLSLAGTALAFPVDFSGDFRLQARSIDDKISGGSADYKASWWQFRARIGFEGKVDKDTTFYGRFSNRNNFGGAPTSGSQGEFDQYGVKLTADNWKFTIGRQAVNLGQGSVISTGADAVGVDNKFDGLVATTKAGDVDMTFIGGKTNNVSGATKEWYGFDLSGKLDKNLAAGLAYGVSKELNVKALKTWAVNFTATPAANFTFNGEYAKSDATANNKAYFLAGTYGWDKSSFTVQYQNVKNSAVDQYNSGIGAIAYPFVGNDLTTGTTGYKGFTYVYGQQLTKAASLHVIYMDLKVDGKTGSDKELAAGVVWKF